MFGNKVEFLINLWRALKAIVKINDMHPIENINKYKKLIFTT